MAPSHDVGRELLFGVLALQNGMVTRDQLVLAFATWSATTGQSLALILEEQGAIQPEHRSILEALAAAHQKRHGGDLERSLSSLDVSDSTRQALATLGGTAIEETLLYLGGDSGTADNALERTTTYEGTHRAGAGERFRKLRPHAQGGLGAVFVALDTELNREVALKQILDHYADDPWNRQRFLVEAEITGGLEHPGIVPVYALGTYASGRPYYAMRFVQGDSLKEALKRHHAQGRDASGLELRRLLRRFLDVCNAIDYAHSRGVLHRDIKPGNIIVGKHGETLVVDWGLAKPAWQAEERHDAAERTLRPASAQGSTETQPGEARGTPAYMSPEQAAGDLEQLSPRSDVYALGATLYCVLTGKPPFEGDVGTVLQKVRRGEFAPPRQLDASIDPALEAVCLQAMALRPEDRYASCRALADDVERWLADEPVRAWREPWLRRARRFVQKHRTLVTTAAASGLVALAALSVLTAMARRSAQVLTERNQLLSDANLRTAEALALAEAGERKARQAVDTYFTRVSEDKLFDVPGLQPLRRDLLRQALEYYQGFLDSRPSTATAGSPAEELQHNIATAQLRVGVIQSELGANEAALAALDKARTRFEHELVDSPDDPGLRGELASTIHAQGVSHENLGHFQEASAAYAESARLFAAAAAAGPDRISLRRRQARALRNMASTLVRLGQYAEALTAIDQSLALCESLLTEYPDQLETLQVQGLALEQRSYLGFLKGQIKTAYQDAQGAQAAYQRLVSGQPSNLEAQYLLAGSLMRLGTYERMLSQPENARKYFDGAIKQLERLVGLNPDVNNYRVMLADGYNLLGDVERDTGHLEALGEAASKALALLEPPGTPSSDFAANHERSKAHNNLGRFQAARGQTAEARSEFLRAAELLLVQKSNNANDLYNAACNLALAVPFDRADIDPGTARREREQLSQRAIAILKAAIEGGFQSEFQSDPDFDSLQKRPDFQALRLDRDFPRQPFLPEPGAR